MRETQPGKGGHRETNIGAFEGAPLLHAELHFAGKARGAVGAPCVINPRDLDIHLCLPVVPPPPSPPAALSRVVVVEGRGLARGGVSRECDGVGLACGG